HQLRGGSCASVCHHEDPRSVGVAIALLAGGQALLNEVDTLKNRLGHRCVAAGLEVRQLGCCGGDEALCGLDLTTESDRADPHPAGGLWVFKNLSWQGSKSCIQLVDLPGL